MAGGGLGWRAAPWRSRTFRVVLASTLVMPMGVRLLSPALPLLVEEFGVSDVTASLTVSAYFLPGVVLSPVLGALAASAGRRRVLVPCLFVFGLAGGVIGFVDRFSSIVLLRSLQGAAAAGVFVVTVTLLADTYDEPQRSSAFGINTSALFVGATVYPLVGGALAPRGWNAPFFLYFLAAPVCLLALFGLDDSGGDGADVSSSVRDAVETIPAGRALPLYVAAFAAEAISFGAILTALPFLLAATYRLGPIGIGVIVTAASVAAAVGAAATGGLANRIHHDQLVAIGFGAYGVSLLGIWITQSPLFVGLATILFGAGWGTILPAADVAISDLAPVDTRAGALSLRNSATFLGRCVGPASFTGVAVVLGYRPVLLGGSLVSFAVGIVVLAAAGR